MNRRVSRGRARNTPAPNRSRSNRAPPTAIISIAQHASPNVIGQSEFFRPQFIAKSKLVTINPSSNRFSIHDINAQPFSDPRPIIAPPRAALNPVRHDSPRSGMPILQSLQGRGRFNDPVLSAITSNLVRKSSDPLTSPTAQTRTPVASATGVRCLTLAVTYFPADAVSSAPRA